MALNMLCSLYQLVNPQLHVFHTNFFIRLNTVQFRIPTEATRVDLRSYFQHISHMPVATVQARIQHRQDIRDQLLEGQWCSQSYNPKCGGIPAGLAFEG
ncbi:39S ribosomal protein L23; mitochondrial [Camelus dromedarius]|uniref:Large ribosomal subunit protein uL23m n=1 Tax=Camelus dromedarius TaxID=9838 RepID=A0A5N4BZF5_CAMDR|nr:39S ribosomal protein L23; mitochondrial [Camelus dromedarius]